MPGLRIGQIAERTGIAPSAIRYYEREGLIPNAERRNGRRVYDERILERLALIDLVRNAGFTVAETRALLRGFARNAPPGKRWHALAKGKIAELDQRIVEAERMKGMLVRVMRCECPTFEDCSRAISRTGRR